MIALGSRWFRLGLTVAGILACHVWLSASPARADTAVVLETAVDKALPGAVGRVSDEVSTPTQSAHSVASDAVERASKAVPPVRDAVDLVDPVVERAVEPVAAAVDDVTGDRSLVPDRGSPNFDSGGGRAGPRRTPVAAQTSVRHRTRDPSASATRGGRKHLAPRPGASVVAVPAGAVDPESVRAADATARRARGRGAGTPAAPRAAQPPITPEVERQLVAVVGAITGVVLTFICAVWAARAGPLVRNRPVAALPG